MDKSSVLVRVAENGRIGLPAHQRRLAGIENGGLVRLDVCNGELRIRPVDAIMNDLQERLAKYAAGPVSGVDMLLEERRREVALEKQEERDRPGA